MRVNILDTRISLSKLFSIPTHLVVLLLTLLFLYLLIISVANDVESYLYIWEESQSMGLFEMFRFYRMEFGSLFIIWGLSKYFSGISMIFLAGAIGMIAKYWIFISYVHRGFLAYILYVLTFAHILDASQLRASLALCFLLYALLSGPKSKYTYLWLASFAMFFHYSGVIILALYFTRAPILLGFLICIISLGFGWIILSSPYLSFATVWLSTATDSVSFINSFWMMQLLILIICVLSWSKLSEGQTRGAVLNMAGVILYVVFYDNPIVAHRLRELSQLGILAILFLGPERLTPLKFGVAACFAYIVSYNLFLVFSEMMTIK